MYGQYDIKDFERQIKYFQDRPKELERIAECGMRFAENNYNPDILAEILFTKIRDIKNNIDNCKQLC